jgi:outer membrane protein assembly factor BamB
MHPHLLRSRLRTRPSRALPLLALAAGLGLLPAAAADWPQWRGPQRNGVSSEPLRVTRWPVSGPKKLWQAQVGMGFSSVAVVGGRVYTLGNLGSQDVVYCLNAGNGSVVWKFPYAQAAGDYEGPRAAPVVEGGRVYTLSRDGLALCLDAATGRRIWQNNIAQATRAQSPQWGFAGAPLVDGSRVIYNVGTSGTAVDKNTGKIVWQTGGGQAGYAGPMPYSAGGRRGIAIFTSTGLVGVDPATGRTQWQHPWDTSHGVNAADPIFSGDMVFISSGYNRGCALLRIGGARPQVLWENKNMRNHFNTCVLIGGQLYGNDDGKLVCIDLRTGNTRWRGIGMDKGGLITADGKLLILTGRGELAIAAANPSGYSELARARVLGGECWPHPVLSGGRAYCRNRQGSLVCVDLSAG